MDLVAHGLVFSRDIPPSKPSIYNLNSSSSLSVLSLGDTVEIPAVLTPPGAMDVDGFMSPSNLLRLTVTDINIKIQGPPTQEFIDRVDTVCHFAIASPPQAKFFSDAGSRETGSRTT